MKEIETDRRFDMKKKLRLSYLDACEVAIEINLSQKSGRDFWREIWDTVCVSDFPDAIRGNSGGLGAILSVGFLFEVTNQPAKF